MMILVSRAASLTIKLVLISVAAIGAKAGLLTETINKIDMITAMIPSTGMATATQSDKDD
jgi:hypothetical protein